MDHDEVGQLKTLVDQLKSLIRTKDEEVQEKNKTLKESDSKLSKLKLQVKAKEAKISSLNKQLNAQSKKGSNDPQGRESVTVLKESLQEKEGTIKQQLKVIKDQGQRLTDVQKDLDEKCLIIESYSNSEDARKLEELNQSIVNKDELISAFTSQIQGLEGTIRDQQRDGQVLQNKLLETQTLSEQQKLLLDKLSATVGEQEEKVAMVAEERSTGFSHLQSNMEELAEQVVSLTAKLQDKEGTVSILEAHILQLKKEHEAQMADVMEGNQEQDELLRTLKRRMHEQDEVMSGKEKVLQLLQDEATDRIQEHGELQRTISILQQNLRETVESKELLQEALKSKERSHSPSLTKGVSSTLLEEKEKLIEVKDNVIRELSETIQLKESENKSATEYSTALQEESVTLKEKIATLEESVDKWQDLAQDSSKALEAKEQEHNLTVAHFQDTVKNIMEELSQSKKLYDELTEDSEKRMKTVLTELDSQTKVLEKQTKDMSLLLQEKAELENQLGTIPSTVQEAIQKSTTDFEHKATEKETEFNALKEEHSRMEIEVRNLKKENESLQANQTRLEESLESSLSENKNLQELIDSSSKECRTLGEMIQSVENEKQKCVEEFCKKEENLMASWNQQRNNLLQELQEIESKCRKESELEISTLRNRLNELSQTIEDKSQKEQLLNDSLEGSSQKLKLLEEELQSRQDINDVLKIDLKTFEQKTQQMVMDYEKKCSDLDRDNSKLVTEIQQSVANYQNLKSELDAAYQDNLRLEEVLNEHKSSVDSSKLQEENLQSQLDDLMKSHSLELKKLQEMIHDLGNEKDSLSNTVESMKHDNNLQCDKLTAHIAMLEEELDAAKEDLNTANEEKKSTLQQLKENEKLVATLQEKYEASQEESAGFRSQLEAVSSSNEDFKNQVQGLSSLQAAYNKVVSEKEILDENLLQIKEELSILKIEKDEHQNQVKNLTQTLEDEFFKNTRLQTEQENLRQCFDEKNEICERLEKEMLELKNLYEDSTKVIETLQSESAHASSKYETEIQSLRVLNSQMMQHKDTALDEHQALLAEYQQLQKSNEILQEMYSSTQTAHSQLQEEMHALSTEQQCHVTRINELETSLKKETEQRDETITSLRIFLSSIEQEKDSLLEENQGLISHIEEHAAKSTGLEAKIQQESETYEQRIESFQSLISNLEKENGSISSQNTKLLQELQDSSEKQSKLEEKLLTFQSMMDVLHASNDASENEKNTLSAELEKVSNQMNSFTFEKQQEQEKFQKMMEDSKFTMASMEEEKKCLEEERETLKAAVVELTNATSTLKDEIEKLTAVNTEQVVKLQTSEQNIGVLSSNNQELQAKNVLLEKTIQENSFNHERQVSELAASTSCLKEERESLAKHLQERTAELDSLKSNLKEKEMDVMKKVQLLEQISTQYSSLRSELEASHTEYKRLMTEMGTPGLSEEDVKAEVRQSQKQVAVETELTETKKRLHDVESQRDDASHEAALLKRLQREHSHEFDDGDGMRFISEPSGSAHKGGLEYLQMQLAELANEQEQQTIEHQRITSVLSNKIERITAEKDSILESLEKQTLHFDEVLKSLNEKEAECQQLDSVISEQQRDLTRVHEELSKVSKSSHHQQKSFHELDDRFLQLQDKNKSLHEILESSESAKDELEEELKEAKLLTKSSHQQNIALEEQVETLKNTVAVLQPDLDQAMEQVDVLSKQYTDDTSKLKSLLREKDEEIDALQEDVNVKSQDNLNLTQLLQERSSECSDLNELLNAQTDKVGQLETLIRQHETELALISELQGEKENAATKARELNEYISKLEDNDNENKATIQDLMTKVDSLQSDLIDKEGSIERLSRESSRIKESHQKREANSESRLTDTENELISLRDQLTRSAQAISSLSKTIEVKDDELSILKETLEKRENQQFTTQEELANMQQLLQVKEESFRQQLLIENDKFEQMKTEYSLSMDNLKSELNSMSSEYSQLKELHESQKEEVQNLTSHLEQQIEEADSYHKSKIISLQEEITILQEKAAILSVEKETANTELFNEREKTLVLQETIEKWETEAQEKSKLCDSLHNTVNLLNERTEDTAGKLRELEQQNLVLQRNLSETSEKATEKENLVAKLDEALTMSNAEIRKLRDELSEESQRQVSEMDSMLNSSVEERNEHIKTLEAEKRSLEQDLADAKREQTRMKETCAELENEFESARREHEMKLENVAQKHAEDLGVLNSLLEENRSRLEEITQIRKQDELREETWMKTCSDLESQLSRAREDIESSKLHFSTSTENEHNLSCEITRLSDLLNESKGREEEFKATTAKHEAQMEKVKKIVRGLQIQVKQGKQKIAELEKTESGESNQPACPEEQIAKEELITKISELEKNITFHKSHAEEVEMLSVSLKEQLLSSVQALEEFKNQTEEKETHYKTVIDNLNEKLATEIQQSLEFSTKYNQTTENLSTMLNEKEEFEKLLGEARLQYDNLKQTSNTLEESLLTEREKVHELVASLEGKDNEYQTQIATSADTVATLMEEKSNLAVLLSERETKLHDLEESSDEKDQRLQSLLLEIQNKDTELTSKSVEVEEYQQLYEKSCRQFESTKEQSELLQNSLRENIESITNSLSVKDDECKKWMAENEALKETLNQIPADKESSLEQAQTPMKQSQDVVKRHVMELRSRYLYLQKVLEEKIVSHNNEDKSENSKESESNQEFEMGKIFEEYNALHDELVKVVPSANEQEIEMLREQLQLSQQNAESRDSELHKTYETQIHELSDKLEELVSSDKSMKDQLQSYEEQISVNNEMIDNLHRKVEEKDDESRKHAEMSDSALKENASLQDNLKELQCKYEDTEREVMNLKDSASNCQRIHENEISQMTEKTATLEQEKEILVRKHEELMHMIDSQQKVEDPLQQAESAEHVQRESLEAKICDLEAQLQSKMKSFTELQRKLKASLVSRKNVMEKLKAAEKKLTDLESDQSQISTENMNASLDQSFESVSSISSKNLTELNEENTELKSKAIESADKIHKMEIEMESERKKSTEIQDGMMKEITELKDQCEILSTKVESKTKELQEITDLFEETKRLQLEQSRVQVESSYNEKESAMQNEIDSLKQELIKVSNNEESLQFECSKKAEECVSLQEDLSSVLDEKDKLIDKLSDLTKEIQDKDFSLNHLKLKLAESADGSSELEDLRDRLNEQEERNSEMNVIISDMEHDLDKSKKTTREFERINENLEESLLKEKQLSDKRFDELTGLKKEVDLEKQKSETVNAELQKFKEYFKKEKDDLEKRYFTDTELLKTDLAAMKEDRDRYEIQCLTLKKEKERDNAVMETEHIQLLQKSTSDAVKEKEQLQRKLKAALVSRKELIVQEKELKEELESLKCYKEKFEENNKALEELKSKESEKDSGLAEMKARREKDIRILKESRKKVTNLEKENEEQQNTILEEIKKREEVEMKLSELSESLKNKDGDISTLESCNNDLNEMVTALEGKNKGLQKKVEEDIETIRALKKEMKSLQEQGNAGLSQEELEEMKENLESAEWDRETLQESIAKLENEKKEKAALLDKVLQDFERESITKQEMATRCLELEEELNSAKSENLPLLQNLELTNAENKDLISSDDEQVQALKNNILDLTNSLHQAEKNSETTLAQNAVLEEKIKKLELSQKNVLEDMRMEQESIENASPRGDDGHIQSLKEENDKLKESIASLQEIVSSLMSEKDSRQDDSRSTSSPFRASSMSNDIPDDPSVLDQEILLVKRTILEETLGQLKVTQPEDWEQEPGIKKLIDKLEYLSDKAARAKKDLALYREKCQNAEADANKMKLQWDSTQGTLDMNNKTIDQQSHTIEGLQNRIMELESGVEDSENEFELLQLQEEYEKLQAHSQLQIQSFGEINKKNEETVRTLQCQVENLKNERNNLMSMIDTKEQEFLEKLTQQESFYQEESESLKEELWMYKNGSAAVSTLNDEVTNIQKSQQVFDSDQDEKDIRVSSALSFSDVADGYSKIIQNLTNGTFDAAELQEQHQALVEELVKKEEELIHLKQEYQNLSLAHDEMIQNAQLPPSQVLTSERSSGSFSDSESMPPVEVESLLRSDLDETKKKILDTSRQLEQREKLISELVSDCKRLRKQVEEEQSTAASFKTESIDLRSEVQSLACLKTQYESNENHLKSELAVKDRLLERQKSELEYSKKEQERLRNEFGAGTPQEVQAILSAYLDDINSLKSNLLAKSTAFDLKVQENSKLNEELTLKVDEAETLSLEIESITEKLESNVGLIQNLQQQCERLLHENDSFRAQLEAFNDVSRSLEEKEETIKTLVNEKHILNKSIEEKQLTITQLEEDMLQSEKDLESLRVLLFEKEDHITNLEGQQKQTFDELNEKIALLARVETEYAAGKKKIEELISELTAKESALETALNEKEELFVNLERSSSKNLTLQEEIVALRDEADSAKTKLLETSEKFSTYVKTNKDQQQRLNVAEKSLSSLTGELAALHDQYLTNSDIFEEINRTRPVTKVTKEILVQSPSEEARDRGVKFLSAQSLKDKNPLIRLQRKLEAYDETLMWINSSKLELEHKNVELQERYDNLQVAYEENALELERVQESFIEMRKSLGDVEREKETIQEKLNTESQQNSENVKLLLNKESLKLENMKTELDNEKSKNIMLESKLDESEAQLRESDARMQHFRMAEQNLYSQQGQIEQLLVERQQLGGQLKAMHDRLQDYQARYANLHAEYMRLSEVRSDELKGENKVDDAKDESSTPHDQGAPGGPPVRILPDSPQQQNLQHSLEAVNAEKRQLAIRLDQIEDQLQDEILRRENVEDLLQNMRRNQGRMTEVNLDGVTVMSEEEEPILMKPTSIIRKVQSSTSTSFSRWLRGRSLRWANPAKGRMCIHFRPLSFQTLLVLYFIGLHLLLIKCFLL